MKSEKTKGIFQKRATRSIVVIAAVLLIGLAVYLNYRWFYDPSGDIGYGNNNMQDNVGADSTPSGGEADKNDYFASAVLTRQQSRDEAIDVLKLVAAGEDASEEAKAEAEAKISKIATDIQNEANIETLLKAKGFEECVAIIADDSVSVIVRADELQAKQTAQILTVVYESCGIAPENVSIINK